MTKGCGICGEVCQDVPDDRDWISWGGGGLHFKCIDQAKVTADLVRRKLHVFTNEVTDWVIAFDAEDAAKVCEETSGEKYDPEDSGEFVQQDDDATFTLFEEALTKPEPEPIGAEIIEQDPDGSKKTKATHRAWANARGRCFLGSSEY
jgi:hypothetical protein